VEECRSYVHEFQLAGFNGAIGSTDAKHIAVEKCCYGLKNNHLGPKQHLTTRTFNLTMNHRNQILSATVSYPGRWNDKKIVLFDSFVRGIYEGSIMPNLTFELLEYDEAGINMVIKHYQGPWIIDDNKYLRWSITVPPL